VLVVGDEQRRVLLRERRGLQDQRHVLRQPLVTGGDGAVVRVVAQVRRNERVVGRGRRRRQVGGEGAVGDILAALGARSDVVVIDERIVLLGIGIRVAGEARRGHGLLVRLPGATGGGDAVG